MNTKSIEGAWNLTSWTRESNDGTVTTPFGEHPEGLLVYVPGQEPGTGWVSVQMMSDSYEQLALVTRTNSPSIEEIINVLLDPRLSEVKTMSRSILSYNAYFGEYRVQYNSADQSTGTVTHVVHGASLPDLLKMPDQTREFLCCGDELILTERTPNAVATVTWKRHSTARLPA